MKRFTTSILFVLLSFVAVVATADDKLKVLIVDGQNNHGAWPQTTEMMKSFLEQSGRFTVDVERTKYTWKGGERLKRFPLDDGKVYQDLAKPKTDPDFKPEFSRYDCVLNNFGCDAAPWPQATQQAFEKYMSGGGGMVIVHAANNAFGDWDDFNKMIGIGGWGGRNQASGPYVYMDDAGKVVRDPSPGPSGSHGPQHPYQIVTREPDHPITKGLPRTWMHVKDELYQTLRGPAENMTILATAFADKKFNGTGRHEPALMTIHYDQGRIFHTILGHDEHSTACVGFIVTLLRGTEWAATGTVTLTDVPDDFPTASEPSERKD